MKKSTRAIAKNLKKLCETTTSETTTTTTTTSTGTSICDYKPVVVESMRKFYKSTVFSM